jgi:hypothetical protein
MVFVLFLYENKFVLPMATRRKTSNLTRPSRYNANGREGEKLNFDRDMNFYGIYSRNCSGNCVVRSEKRAETGDNRILTSKANLQRLIIFLFLFFSLQQNEAYFATSLVDSAAI